jgi:hypothetical protein
VRSTQREREREREREKENLRRLVAWIECEREGQVCRLSKTMRREMVCRNFFILFFFKKKKIETILHWLKDVILVNRK